MKIGILIWDLALRGGAQRQAVELAKNLHDNGVDVTVYAVYYDPCVYSEILFGIKVIYLRSGSQKIPWIDKSIAGLSLGSLFSIVSEFRYSRTIPNIIGSDIEILNVHENLAFTGAAIWKRKTGKPVLWMMNDLPGIFYKHKHFKTEFINKTIDYITFRIIIRNWYLRSIRSLDKIIVLDRRNRALVQDNVNVIPIVIPSGLDLKKFSFTHRKPYQGRRPFRVLSNGIFFPHRRLEDLVEGIRILSREEINLVWCHVGTDERHPEYARKVRTAVVEASLSKICSFVGKISDEELVHFYQEADAFVFPNFPQTWGLAVFEAMACGTPVVVSRGAGASDVLTDEENSLLVDPCRPDQIAAALRKLAISPDLWSKLAVKGRKFVEENIRWDIYADKMGEEMEKLVR